MSKRTGSTGASAHCNTLPRRVTCTQPINNYRFMIIHYLQVEDRCKREQVLKAQQRTTAHCSALQRTAAHCNTLQHSVICIWSINNYTKYNYTTNRLMTSCKENTFYGRSSTLQHAATCRWRVNITQLKLYNTSRLQTGVKENRFYRRSSSTRTSTPLRLQLSFIRISVRMNAPCNTHE